jgi:hypothetical protein
LNFYSNPQSMKFGGGLLPFSKSLEKQQLVIFTLPTKLKIKLKWERLLTIEQKLNNGKKVFDRILILSQNNNFSKAQTLFFYQRAALPSLLKKRETRRGESFATPQVIRKVGDGVATLSQPFLHEERALHHPGPVGTGRWGAYPRSGKPLTGYPRLPPPKRGQGKCFALCAVPSGVRWCDLCRGLLLSKTHHLDPRFASRGGQEGTGQRLCSLRSPLRS